MTSQHTALGVLVLGTAIAVIIAVVWRRDAGWGFKEVVKNPAYWSEVDDQQKEAAAAIRAAKSWDDEKIASVVRHFIFEVPLKRDAWTESRVLQELGERTHSAVIGLLNDKGAYQRLVSPTGTDLLPEAPFNRACGLFGDVAPRDAVDAVEPFLDDPSTGIRKEAALVIGKAGTDNIVPLIRKAFTDSDKYTRSYALMGLEYSLKAKRLSQSVVTQIFPDVLRMLGEHQHPDKAAEILYRLDPGRARDFFFSPKVFRADSEIIHEVLETLVNAKAATPRIDLLTLIADLEAKELVYPRNYALGHSLHLLGQGKLPNDAGFLRARLNHPNVNVAEGAAAGLVCLFNLEGFDQKIWEADEKGKYSSLQEYQRYYLAVSLLDSEINNGGFAQYFVNSSGEHWKDALAGLKAMGSNDRLAIVKEAVAVFGPSGPSEDRQTRQEQMSKIYKRNDSIFDELESRYYKSTEVIAVLASVLVLAHPESFR